MDARQQNKGRVCTVEGCSRSAVAKGLCKPHYDMKRDHGRTDYVPVLMNTTRCAADGCDALARQKGLCDKHYQRLRSYGDPNYYPSPRPKKAAIDPVATKHLKRAPNPEHVKPKLGPRSFQGPCSGIGCGRVARRNGKCLRHNRLAKAESAERPMLSPDEIRQIQANRTAGVQQLAEQFSTTPRTVVAVQAGRNWGYRAA